jgi:membrane associated rhomboid family serine protease
MLPLRDNIPTARRPVVTYALIAANVLVYFFWQKGGLTLGDPSSAHYICQLQDWAAIPKEITHPGDQVLIARGCPSDPSAPTYLTIFSAMFMHGGLLHLGGNMLFLWIFGNNVEDAMGPVKFLLFYLLAGVAALALQVAIDPSSQVPTLGASGAIAGVLGGYLLLFPRARVVTVIFIVFFFTILELPALLVLGFWFLEQALLGYFDLAQPTGGGGGVAYFAHIGGFVFGLAAIRLFSSRKRVDRQNDRMGFSRR